MQYRKFKADQLFTGYEMLDNRHVLVTDPLGMVQGIVDVDEAGDNVQHYDGILTPGFINCHCHLELSHMKGLLPEKTGLVDFVWNVVTQRHFVEDEIKAAIVVAEQQMLVNGIVAVGDICNTLYTLEQKAKSKLQYYNFIEASGWLPGVAAERFSRIMQQYQAYAAMPGTAAVVPHAPYSVSPMLWQLLKKEFKGKVVSIHNQETAFEDEFFEQGTGDFSRLFTMMNIDNTHFVPAGKSSLAACLPNIAGADTVVLVHNTFTKEADIKYAQQMARNNDHAIYWCLCIKANLYIEDSTPPVNLLRLYNSNIVVGTDSLASNNSLNVLDELHVIKKHYADVGLSELLGWATINGAKALNLQQVLGSFEHGKTPGVLMIDEKLTRVERLI